MNFFGIGPLEILLAAIIAIIVLGPERFPGLAVQIARGIKYLRGYATDSTAELRAEFQELTKEYESLRGELADVRGSLTKSAGSVTGEIERVVTETKPALQQVMDATKPIIEPGGDLPPDTPKTNGAAPE